MFQSFIFVIFICIVSSIPELEYKKVNSSILFEEMGKVGTSIEIIEVKFELPLKTINGRIERILWMMKHSIKKMRKVNISRTLMDTLQTRADVIDNHMKELMTLSGCKDDRRVKRQAVIGLGLLGGWMAKGIFSSFFGSQQTRYESDILDTLAIQEENLRGIHKAIDAMADKYSMLINITRAMHDELVEVEKVEVMITVLTSISENIGRWTRGLQTGMTGRLTPDLLSIHDAKIIMEKISQREHDGSISLVDSENIGNLYSLPIQLQTTATGVDVAIRLPLYFKKDLYTLYKYRELPITIRDGVRMSYRSHVGKYLLMDAIKGIYKEVETDELLDCISINGIRLCPHLRLFIQSGRGCLPSLIRGDFPAARNRCDIMLHQGDDVFVSQVSDEQIFIDTQRAQMTQASCTGPPSTEHREVLTEGAWMLMLHGRCSVRIGDYIIGERPRTSVMRLRAVETALLEKAEDIVKALDLEEHWVYGPALTDIKEQLQTFAEPDKPVSVKHLRRLAQAARVVDNRLFIYLVMIIEFIIIIVISVFFGRLLFKIKNQRAIATE